MGGGRKERGEAGTTNKERGPISQRGALENSEDPLTELQEWRFMFFSQPEYAMHKGKYRGEIPSQVERRIEFDMYVKEYRQFEAQTTQIVSRGTLDLEPWNQSQRRRRPGQTRRSSHLTKDCSYRQSHHLSLIFNMG